MSILERYFVRPQTTDRIRARWLGPAINRYAEWLAERGVGKDTGQRSGQALTHFNDFAQGRGARAWEDLPAHLQPFVDHCYVPAINVSTRVIDGSRRPRTHNDLRHITYIMSRAT